MSPTPRTTALNLNPTPEYTPTYSLNKHVAEARRQMGEQRWADLNREWKA